MTRTTEASDTAARPTPVPPEPESPTAVAATPGEGPRPGPGLRGRWRDWWGGGFSRTPVRTRIVASVAVLVALALASSGVLVYTLESRRVQNLVYENIGQEIRELYKLQYPDSNDQTGDRGPAAFTSSRLLLQSFLLRNVPDDDELFVGWWEGRAQERTGHMLGDLTVDDATFDDTVRTLLPEGGSRTRDVPGVGEYLLTVQPLGRTSSAEPDALVIVSYLDAERDELTQTMRTYSFVALLLLLIIVAVAWLQAGRLLGPLRALRANAEEINATDLSRRLPVATNDDIGQLTRTYNAMLDRMQHGFSAQRQFLDDAGHELRTPLTVLRGHLELVDPHDPADVQETSDLLLDEVDRMSRLVDELILLAKSDRPDFVRRTEVVLTDLLEQVHRKAGALDASRTWRLGELPPPDLVVLLDEQRLTQALLQLCDNAVKHTRPGDSITLAAKQVPGAVRLSVTDTGDGVEPAARERIFERFGRAHVPEGDEGFGLGLSIVRAISEAHDASVHVEDGPGGGARFVIEIPLLEGPTPWPES